MQLAQNCSKTGWRPSFKHVLEAVEVLDIGLHIAKIHILQMLLTTPKNSNSLTFNLKKLQWFLVKLFKTK